MPDYAEIIHQHIAALSVPGNRFKNVEGIEHRENYIRQILEKSYIPFEIQTFVGWGRLGKNIIVRKTGLKGDSQGKIIFGAHYDTVPHSPGANDNSGAVACLLAVLQAIYANRLSSQTDLEIVFWDMEEVGKLGSKHYVENIPASEQGEMLSIVLDMIGWSSAGIFTQTIPLPLLFVYPRVYIWEMLRLFRADYHLTVARKQDITLLKTRSANKLGHLLTVPDDLELADKLGLCDSDHHNFWLAGMSSVLITDSGRFREPKAYHTIYDTPEKVSIEFILLVFEYLFKLCSSEGLP